jgi:hypothetical protein
MNLCIICNQYLIISHLFHFTYLYLYHSLSFISETCESRPLVTTFDHQSPQRSHRLPDFSQALIAALKQYWSSTKSSISARSHRDASHLAACQSHEKRSSDGWPLLT